MEISIFKKEVKELSNVPRIVCRPYSKVIISGERSSNGEFDQENTLLRLPDLDFSLIFPRDKNRVIVIEVKP